MRKIGHNTYIKVVFDCVRLIITPMVESGKFLHEYDAEVRLTENEANELLEGYTKESLENMHAAVQKRLKMCAENESANINSGKKK